jgi:hypothetical protein
VTGPRRSKLFHAIVVAGAGLVGGCSRTLTASPDAAADAVADVAADGSGGADSSGERDRFEVPLDAGFIDTPSADRTCTCRGDSGISCQICDCGCYTLDAGACFPCYV